MSAEEVRIRSDAGNPAGDEPCVLPGCQTSTQRMSAGEQELARLLAGGLCVVVDCLARLLGHFEPYGLPSLLLADCRPDRLHIRWVQRPRPLAPSHHNRAACCRWLG